MDYFVFLEFCESLYPLGMVRGRAVIQEELHARNVVSNSTAYFTARMGTAYINAAIRWDRSACADRARVLVGTPPSTAIGAPNDRFGMFAVHFHGRRANASNASVPLGQGEALPQQHEVWARERDSSPQPRAGNRRSETLRRLREVERRREVAVSGRTSCPILDRPARRR
jgi:hypothetical protein